MKDVFSSSCFFCYYTNVQSIRNKSSEILNLIWQHKPLILGFTETWTTEDIFDGELNIPGYNMYRSDRMHGGVILYIHQSLVSRRCQLRSG